MFLIGPPYLADFQDLCANLCESGVLLASEFPHSAVALSLSD